MGITGVFSEVAMRGHEQVNFFNYPAVGLKAIVAIHNSVLGPALGGCRMRVYLDEAQALEDVLRLSEGMTYKNSVAGMDLGGGKACIILDPNWKGDPAARAALFKQFGQCLNSLAGRYYTAEDMGTSPSDMHHVREVTSFVVGFPIAEGGSGDPSPWTARGVFNSIEAVCARVFKSQDLSQRSVAIQGVGHVGLPLVRKLREVGARVVVADTNQSALDEARDKFGAEVVALEQIYDADCEVFAPCAIGQTVNAETLPRLKSRIICGAANNQLVDASLYSQLADKKIVYCPDFVVNAGGVISVGAELRAGGWDEAWVSAKVRAIGETTERIIAESESTGRPTEAIALELARKRIAEYKKS